MRKIRLDNTTIDGLTDVFFADDVEVDCPQKLEVNQVSNPKYVLISLHIKDAYEMEYIEDSKTVANPTVYQMKDYLTPVELTRSERYTEHVLQKVIEHFQKYGRIEEIHLTGHGVPGAMGDKHEGTAFVLSWFLDELAHFEHMNGKVVNRIVFNGCNTFSKLNDAAVAYYCDYAKTNKTQLVGSTSEIVGMASFSGAHYNVGRYVQFSPDGKIIRDKLDTRFDPYVLTLENDTSWTAFYLGHTAEEGLKLKQQYQQHQEQETKVKSPIMKR